MLVCSPSLVPHRVSGEDGSGTDSLMKSEIIQFKVHPSRVNLETTRGRTSSMHMHMRSSGFSTRFITIKRAGSFRIVHSAGSSLRVYSSSFHNICATVKSSFSK